MGSTIDRAREQTHYTVFSSVDTAPTFGIPVYCVRRPLFLVAVPWVYSCMWLVSVGCITQFFSMFPLLSDDFPEVSGGSLGLEGFWGVDKLVRASGSYSEVLFLCFCCAPFYLA